MSHIDHFREKWVGGRMSTWRIKNIRKRIDIYE